MQGDKINFQDEESEIVNEQSERSSIKISTDDQRGLFHFSYPEISFSLKTTNTVYKESNWPFDGTKPIIFILSKDVKHIPLSQNQDVKWVVIANRKSSILHYKLPPEIDLLIITELDKKIFTEASKGQLYLRSLLSSIVAWHNNLENYMYLTKEMHDCFPLIVSDQGGINTIYATMLCSVISNNLFCLTKSLDPADDSNHLPKLKLVNLKPMRQVYKSPMELYKSEVSSPTIIIGQNILQSQQQPLDRVPRQFNLEGGIAPKYQPAGHLPKFPQYERKSEFETYQYNHRVDFISLPFTLTKIQREPIDIDTDEIKATLHTAGNRFDNSKPMFFIFAGRKAAALVPDVDGINARCVLILTQDEYAELIESCDISPEIDCLVLHRISSQTHGEFDKLHLITARRMAAFLVARYFQLKHFAALDDNISSVSFKSPFSNIVGLYHLLLSQLKNNGCISISTFSLKRKIRPNDLGSKFFLFNMALIRKYLPTMKDLFLLLPPASEANKPLEDAYFQAFLASMLNGIAKGYHVLPKDFAVLHRSRQYRNACASTGMKASLFSGPENSALLTAQQSECLDVMLLTLNEYIKTKIQWYEEKAKKIETLDLGTTHAMVHHIKPSQLPALSRHRHGLFIEEYREILNNINNENNFLRDYQITTIKAVANHSGFFCAVLNATGCGKSRVIYKMASEAFPLLNKGEIVAIITPQIGLSNQLYENFKEYYDEFNESNFPLERVLTVSSDDQSCSRDLLDRNHTLSKHKHIIIFCLNSFVDFYQKEENRARIRLALYDEFHDYATQLSPLIQAQPQDSLFVGCSATMPLQSVLGDPIYSYSFSQAIKDGYLAPIIADGFGINFPDNIKEFIPFVPLILKNQLHPGFGEKTHLASTKGIIYLPTIEDCEILAKVMSQANISHIVIHSKKKNCKQDIKRFLAQDSGYILAVKMLCFGFNDVNLGNVIILQKLNDPDNPHHINLLQQLIGRPARKQGDKIGYVLTFNDNKLLIDKILQDTPHTHIPTNDYLGQSNIYYVDPHTGRYNVTYNPELSHENTPSIYYLDSQTGECHGTDNAEMSGAFSAKFILEPSRDYFNRRSLHEKCFPSKEHQEDEPICQDKQTQDNNEINDDIDYEKNILLGFVDPISFLINSKKNHQQIKNKRCQNSRPRSKVSRRVK